MSSLRGPQRQVLLTIQDLVERSKDRAILDAEIVRATRIALDGVRDCWRILAEEGLVSVWNTTEGVNVSIEAKGRQAIRDLLPQPAVTIGGESGQNRIKIVPKGLRSYDEDDADFFLELLPGPRRADGLPESVHFWKVRIDETDSEKTFRVGVHLRAERLRQVVLGESRIVATTLGSPWSPVYVEAIADDTETRLLNGLRKQIPGVTADLSLPDVLVALKAGMPANKVLLVLDQFEQWLHGRRGEEDTELAQALGQCDGGRVQAIVMVRDDFSVALLRFMGTLGINVVQGHNFALVDLFDIRHATKVLTAFGQAFGALPQDQKSITKDHWRFLDASVAGMRPKTVVSSPFGWPFSPRW